MRPATFRLVLLNDAPAWRRLIAAVAGVAVGVALLFTLLGAHAGLDARDARTWWMNLAVHPAVDESGAAIPLTDDTALVSGHIDVFRGNPVWQLDVAVTPSSRIRLPDGQVPPPIGQSLVSKALASQISHVPRNQLGNRFGVLAGQIPPSMLVGPDSLVVIHPVEEQVLRDRGKVWLIDNFDGIQPSTDGVYSMMLIIGAIALIIPVVLLVSIVTQLGAAQRRERLQTLRLIGASPGTVSRMAAGEMALMTAIGSLAGWGLFYLLRPIAAQVKVDTTRFYPTDLTVSPLQALAVIAGVVAVSSMTAVWRVTRDGIGPLGVTRQDKETVPGVIRLAPLVTGAVLISVGAFADLQDVMRRQQLAIGGFALIAVGIIVAGPWLVHRLSGMLTRRAASAPALVAAGWFRRHPAASFRSVAGLVVALFMVTVFAGMASVATVSLHPTERSGLMAADTARARLVAGADADALAAGIRQVGGVKGVVIGYAIEPGSGDVSRTVVEAADAGLLGFPDTPERGCALFVDAFFVDPVNTNPVPLEPVECPTAGEPNFVYVVTDGTRDAMERAQTWTSSSPALATSLATRSDQGGVSAAGAVETLATMAYLGVVIAIVIAGVSLAVSSAASVMDNKRSFGLMRLMGMPTGVLRRVIATQAMVPLLATIGATIATGFAVAYALITGWAPSLRMSWPDPRYYVAIAVATLIAAIAVAATFTVATAATSAETTRFE